jgi:hypothetical protein
MDKKGVIMTISSLPISFSPETSDSIIGTVILAKSLDTAQIQGQDLIRMMEQSVTPNLGQNIDIRV